MIHIQGRNIAPADALRHEIHEERIGPDAAQTFQCLARYHGRRYKTSMIRQESHIHDHWIDHRIVKLMRRFSRVMEAGSLSGAIQTKSDSDGGAPGGRTEGDLPRRPTTTHSSKLHQP
jgi:hypothetical protein